MKITLILTLSVVLCRLFSVTYTIKQDGSGDFLTITEGITAAQHGDTLIVYPGIYYEHINYSGKNITITSLYQAPGDEEIIQQTIIDGNQEWTVVTFNQNETRNAVLSGFVIRNGYREYSDDYSYGGGIHIAGNSSPVIRNCFIEYNNSRVGAGILALNNANPLLKNNTISYNNAISGGGGVCCSNNGNIEFCPVELNSIYLNYAGMNSSDLLISSSNQTPVVLDTLTVLNPDIFFFVVNYNRIPDDFSLTILNGKITPIDADLYLSPDGCDTNSGLTPDEPVRTFRKAMTYIASNETTPRTVYVSEGIYSPTLNNQFFPVQIRDNVRITGLHKETTILDAEYHSWHFSAYMNPAFSPDNTEVYVSNYSVENLTLINGGNQVHSFMPGSIFLYYAAEYSLKNIDIINTETRNRAVVANLQCTDGYIRDLLIKDNAGGRGFGYTHGFYPYKFYAENLRILNSVYGGGVNATGGGMTIGLDYFQQSDEYTNATIVNLEVTDCEVGYIDPMWINTPWGNVTILTAKVRLINATIGNNFVQYAPNGAGLSVQWGGNLELINSIVYGNSPHQIALGVVDIPPIPNRITISHSLVQNGLAGIHSLSGSNVINWGAGNIDANPYWMGDFNPDYPYMQAANSPVRDAGTLDIPDFEFPEYDLAGNPRIFGLSVDMGAYEWHPSVNIDHDVNSLPEIPTNDYNLHNYPNPVTSIQGFNSKGRKGVGTLISFRLPAAGNVELDIYNLKGQFVRKIFNAYAARGEYEVLWDGRDEQGRTVSTGFYVYRLKIDNANVASGRCVFVK